MSQEIASFITELKNINIEIKNRKEQLFKFKKRKEEIEKTIQDFLVEKDQPGVKYNGTAVVLEEKIRRIRKSKEEKNNDCINVLKHYNISNADKIYNEIISASKGVEETKKAVKISNINKFKT